MLEASRGEKRPDDVIGAAITIANIATGEIQEEVEKMSEPQRHEQRRRCVNVRAHRNSRGRDRQGRRGV